MRRRAVLLLAAGLLMTGTTAGGSRAHEGDHGPSPADPPKGETAEEPRSGPEVAQGDFHPESDRGRRVFGSARLVRHDDRTEIHVHLHGLEPETSYPMHLHAGTCEKIGPHYRDDPDGPGEPPNELWPSSDPDDPEAGVTSDDDGYATAFGEAPWRARPEARAVMLHDVEGQMMACADLT